MAAHKGNSYAQKYSADDIIAIMDSLAEDLKKGVCKHLEGALLKQGLYRQLIHSWVETHKNNTDVLDAIKRVMGKDSLGHLAIQANMLDGEIDRVAGVWISKTVYGDTETPDSSSVASPPNITVNVVQSKPKEEYE